MWPFSTKEPLSADKLPIPDTWAVLNGHDETGKPMVVRAHTGYKKFKGVTGYAHCVLIDVPMIDTSRDGFPNPGETEELTRIEDDICTVFEANRDSIFVATKTIPGIRQYLLYTRNLEAIQQKFDNELLARVFSHRVHLKVEPDRDWRTYNKLV